MSRGTKKIKLCPECKKRPRARCRGDGIRATCGALICVRRRRQRTAQSGNLGRYNERPMPETLNLPEGPGICDRCHGAKWFTSFDGIAWEGCQHCGWAQPIRIHRIAPPINKPRLPDLTGTSKVCCRCKIEKPVEEFYAERSEHGRVSRRCKECQRIVMRQMRAMGVKAAAAYRRKKKRLS